ncbi:CBS domain-containing protein [Archangium violaceum]|uniref:CBS domain-containing protein n=1 Tax=Archangium violaceum TaxID=83451 RepID=UPI0036DE6B33
MWVRDVMARGVAVVRPETSFREAVARMRQSRCPLVVVWDGQDIHGLVTMRALVLGAEAWAQGYPIHGVGDVVSHDFILTHEGEAVVELARRLVHAGARRAIVVDGDIRAVGIVSPLELARADSPEMYVSELTGGTTP